MAISHSRRRASKAAWEKRAERVRRQILVSQGLWPMPTKTPLNAVIHGKIERAEYTVEKVYFESSPGFFVTGNLYRPRNVTGKLPGVLFAHGHWTNARLSESTDAELRREIADGEERFEQGGRSRFQSMCVQLARMGCVVWQWDMLGDSDSQQLSHAAGPRIRQAAARDEHDRELGPLQSAGRGASAKRDGPANVELDPLARLPVEPAGSRSRPHRHHRRQRRRHANDAARRD